VSDAPPDDVPGDLAEHLRTLEHRRTQALVAQDMVLARRLHAEDYQLITPAGKTFDRQSYLDAIECGELRYVAWECGEIAVRLSPAMALLRYRARLVFPSGKVVDCWHTDSYELRAQTWQAVWSQATALALPPAA
jgi:hypothetical protein